MLRNTANHWCTTIFTFFPNANRNNYITNAIESMSESSFALVKHQEIGNSFKFSTWAHVKRELFFQMYGGFAKVLPTDVFPDMANNVTIKVLFTFQDAFTFPVNVWAQKNKMEIHDFEFQTDSSQFHSTCRTTGSTQQNNMDRFRRHVEQKKRQQNLVLHKNPRPSIRVL